MSLRQAVSEVNAIPALCSSPRQGWGEWFDLVQVGIDPRGPLRGWQVTMRLVYGGLSPEGPVPAHKAVLLSPTTCQGCMTDRSSYRKARGRNASIDFSTCTLVPFCTHCTQRGVPILPEKTLTLGWRAPCKGHLPSPAHRVIPGKKGKMSLRGVTGTKTHAGC